MLIILFIIHFFAMLNTLDIPTSSRSHRLQPKRWVQKLTQTCTPAFSMPLKFGVAVCPCAWYKLYTPLSHLSCGQYRIIPCVIVGSWHEEKARCCRNAAERVKEYEYQFPTHTLANEEPQNRKKSDDAVLISGEKKMECRKSCPACKRAKRKVTTAPGSGT